MEFTLYFIAVNGNPAEASIFYRDRESVNHVFSYSDPRGLRSIYSVNVITGAVSEIGK